MPSRVFSGQITSFRTILAMHLQYSIVEYLGNDEIIIIDSCVQIFTFSSISGRTSTE
jgi:hypothetical protein